MLSPSGGCPRFATASTCSSVASSEAMNASSSSSTRGRGGGLNAGGTVLPLCTVSIPDSNPCPNDSGIISDAVAVTASRDMELVRTNRRPAASDESCSPPVNVAVDACRRLQPLQSEPRSIWCGIGAESSCSGGFSCSAGGDTFATCVPTAAAAAAAAALLGLRNKWSRPRCSARWSVSE